MQEPFMISLDLSNKHIDSVTTECLVFFIPRVCEVNADLSDVCELFSLDLSQVFQEHGFSGDEKSFLLLTPSSTESLKAKNLKLCFIGVGHYNDQNLENLRKYRNAIGNAIKKLCKLKIKKASLQIKDMRQTGLNFQDLTKDVLITSLLSDYSFDDFKSKKKEQLIETKINLNLSQSPDFDLSTALFEGKVLADAINFTRHIADLPPNIANPGYLAEIAKQTADKFNLKCNVFGEEKAKELGMGGFVAVGSGSDHEAKFVELVYNCGDPKAKTVALVGKGVSLDSGGISLKPWKFMTGMKYDMSGAAAVIGAIRCIAQLGTKVNVVALTPFVENMPSGKCVRQDDILTHLNGMTTEVQNTDAEGRLILADAIAYAEKFHSPDAIIDVATLTGACVVALGHFYTGVMSQDNDLVAQLLKAADHTGDFLWRLPCSDLFDAAIDSKVADVANVGNSAYGAGTVTAAMFLKRFVSKARWAHLDIAGSSNDLPDANYLGKGATGVGVRLLARFVAQYC
jgi:leucyl aminopeptidase